MEYKVTEISLIEFTHLDIDPSIMPSTEHGIGLDISDADNNISIITFYHKYKTIQRGKDVCVIETKTSFASNSKKIIDIVFLTLKAIDFTTAILSVESSKVYPKAVPLDYPKEDILLATIKEQLNRLN